MESLIIYELKVAASIAIFYAFYRLLLSHETLHRLNRIVLISTAVLSFILPLCVITIHKNVELPFIPQGTENTLNQTAEAASTGAATEWWWITLTAIYIIGVVACLLKTGISVLGVYNLIRKGKINYLPDGSKIVVIDDNIAPCSWMNSIIMSRENFEKGSREILAHEQAHIEFGHSKDVLVVDILTAFQWFNPMMWILREDLRAVHEFEADDAVLSKGVNIKDYQYLLIKKAISESGYSVTNSFNHSILKNRITMMSKSKTNNVKGLRVLYILPLICVSLAVYAEEKVSYQLVKQNKDNTIALKQEDSTAKSSIKIVAKNGSTKDLNNKAADIKIIDASGKKTGDNANVDSLITARDGKDGTNIISYEEMKSISPEGIASMNVFKGEKAVEVFGDERAAEGAIVIKLKTGNEYTVYLADGNNAKKFHIVDASEEEVSSKSNTGISKDGAGAPETEASKAGVGTLMYNKGMDKNNVVYVVVDGDKSYYTTGDKINDFKAEEIESVNVHKDEAGIKKYAEGLKVSASVEGVIVIKLKK